MSETVSSAFFYYLEMTFHDDKSTSGDKQSTTVSYSFGSTIGDTTAGANLSNDLYFKDGKYCGSQESTGTVKIICTLESFMYDKKIYEPGKLRLRFKLTYPDNKRYKSVSYAEYFKEARFKLKKQNIVEKIKKDDNGKDIIPENYEGFDVAVNYFTFYIEETDENKVSETQAITHIDIEAYSPDKFLTLPNFSKAYTAKKLYGDIIYNGGEIFWTEFLLSQIKNVSGGKGAIPVLMNFNALRYKEKANPDNKGEYIQPYLVQYNESPYDFLVRTLNRCRECFYYENGAIILGWMQPDQISTTSTAVNDIDPATVSSTIKIDNSDYIKARLKSQTVSRTYAKAVYADYTRYNKNKDDKTIKDETEKATNYDVSPFSANENLAINPTKWNYISAKDFPFEELLWNFFDCFNTKNWADICATFVIDDFLKMLTLERSLDMSMTNYEKRYFNGGEFYEKERAESENKLRAFTTGSDLLADKMPILFDQEFYHDNKKGIIKAEEGRLHLDLRFIFKEILLGTIISFREKKYVVVNIHEKYDTQNGQEYYIEALPFIDDKFYPPMVNDNTFIRTCKPQRAFVTNNMDPLRLGRVQIRYPWQKHYASRYDEEVDGVKDPSTVKKTDENKWHEISSPWLRITLPMASVDSGFMFWPEVGDEVIVNYENGNVEKPYVEGMVYNSQHKPGEDEKGPGQRSITSRNGHSIKFADPGGGTAAIYSFFPAMKFLSGIVPEMKVKLPDPNTNDLFRLMAGGIEISDRYGFYSIKTSTDNRSISIDSPVGNIGLNAFTGITISAPNGDISIEGKNISISAGNILSLESGTNLQERTYKHWPEAKDFGEALLKKFLARIQPIDMKLIRTMAEVFVKPVNGSLVLNSNRYINMMSGESSPNAQLKMVESDLPLIEEYYSKCKGFLEAAILLFDTYLQAMNVYRNNVSSKHNVWESSFNLSASQKVVAKDLPLADLKTKDLGVLSIPAELTDPNATAEAKDANKELRKTTGEVNTIIGEMNGLDIKQFVNKDSKTIFDETLESLKSSLGDKLYNQLKNAADPGRAKILEVLDNEIEDFKFEIDGITSSFTIGVPKLRVLTDPDKKKLKRKLLMECIKNAEAQSREEVGKTKISYYMEIKDSTAESQLSDETEWKAFVDSNFQPISNTLFAPNTLVESLPSTKVKNEANFKKEYLNWWLGGFMEFYNEQNTYDKYQKGGIAFHLREGGANVSSYRLGRTITPMEHQTNGTIDTPQTDLCEYFKSI